MAKRFKVIKGGTAKRGVTSPSSTRKKVVREGSPKFVGPRSKKSEDAEYRSGTAEQGGPNYRKKKKKVRAPMARKIAERFGYSDSDPQYGGGSISRSDRLLKMLYDLGGKYRGGGQEFDD